MNTLIVVATFVLLAMGLWKVTGLFSASVTKDIARAYSAIYTDVTYRAGDSAVSHRIESLVGRADDIGYEVLTGRRTMAVDDAGKTETVTVVLRPKGCPEFEPCDEARRSAVFDDFSTRLMATGSVLRVAQQ